MTDQNLTNKTREELLNIAEATEALKKRYRERYIDFVMPAEGPYSRDKYPKLREFIKAGKNHHFRMYGGANGCLPLESTEVCMADGTKTLLKDIKVGDNILAYDIETKKSFPANVIQTFDNGVKDVYRISFSDGNYVDATENHIFPIQRCSGRYLYKNGKQKPNKIKKVYTRDLKVGNRLLSPAVIDYKIQEELPLDPYFLGCLLGDGCLGYRGKTFTNKDESVLNRIREKYSLTQRQSYPMTYQIDQVVVERDSQGRFQKGEITKRLATLNLEVNGKDKFIPQQYLIASIEDRKELLAGLIDTDGSFGDFTNKSERLVKDFCQLVRSLGGKANYKEVQKKCTNNGKIGTYYRSYWRLNTLLPLCLEYKQKITKRPVDYTNRIITKIELISTEATGCLEVAHKDHCFLVNNYVAVGNSGKTFGGAYEAVMHWTGDYPEWWDGKVQDNPKHWWIVSESAGTFKSSLQVTLIGPNLTEDLGTGLIPKDKIVSVSNWPSVSGTVGEIKIRHKKGHIVTVEVKSFDQERSKLQGANIDGVLFDEEPPIEVYTECVFRLRGNSKKELGMAMLLFTPLKGLSPVVLKYLKNGRYPENGQHPDDPDMYVVRVDMEDVPHLSKQDKEMYLKQSTEADRCARLHGLPAIGAGRIYPIDESQLRVNYLKIAPHWPRAYGMDFGWHKTAVVWGTKDPETGVLYLYGEYYKGNQAPYVHAHAIKQRGAWIPGLADPRGDKGSERDGSKLIDEYMDLGLNLQIDRNRKSLADNSVNAGIARCLNLMESGLLKVTYNLENWFNEFRIYRYDMKDINKVAKNQDDHLMDAMKYLISNFDAVAISALEAEEEMNPEEHNKSTYFKNKGKNDITGY